MASAQLGARALIDLLGDWRSGGPTYEALADRIRLLVLDGRLQTDIRLPAERDLAARLGLSRTTITSAYQRLRDAGFAVSVRGSGTVSRLAVGAPAHDGPADGLLDFTKAAPPATALLGDAVRYAAEQLPRYVAETGYDTVGLPQLREAVAKRYSDRGLATDADEILITVGAQQAINLIARAYVGRSDRVLIESPTYPHAYDAFQAAGARLVTTPVSTEGADGWDVAAFEATVRRSSPVLVYVMPQFQNPTGRVMSARVRSRLLNVAAGQGTVVVADETPAELAIDPSAILPPLGTPPEGATVIHVGSASKVMWGGLRVGWVRAKRSIIRKLASVRANMDLGTPILEQLVVARLFDDLPEILEERRRGLETGRNAIEQALTEVFPDWHVPHVAGGLAVWANIGTPLSSQLALTARAHGLLITAGPRFGIDGAFERFLRIPLTYSAGAVDRAVGALASAWPDATRHPFAEQPGLAAVV